ncbi:transcriptional regulator [Rubrobacter xylanophilus]|uniref:Transcriptional regulator n=1 Tax=Rubrobacter xylanophilus TaxID=49319 RepID=A0A510HLP0_9ACTN|nr:metalloregulator ArsR/SmtB family transcription factor [Rubrobacter xylanophilus]BBL80941.1 transcriptional regulator [Rubrobacter xylanophilus]
MLPREEGCSPTRFLSALEAEDLRASEERFAQLCKALGHPVRVRILRLLLSVETCVCGDIVEALPLAQSTVSQHLKVLKEAGLVEGVIDGPRTCYGVNREALAELKGLADTLL